MIIWNCDVCGESQAVCHGDNRPGRCWTRKIDSSYSEPDAVFCGEACRAKWQLMGHETSGSEEDQNQASPTTNRREGENVQANSTP